MQNRALLEPVLFEEVTCVDGKRIGVATLNAASSLNALSLNMIDLLQAKLNDWEANPCIACVFLQGAGQKAFCAGGDIRQLYESIVASDDAINHYAVDFFTREYQLDYHIHTYTKPIVVWAHGIVMGGGMGLCNGASHRVVTNSTRMAMPEAMIGLYPDVGGSWFLSQLPGRTGLFLGLTGATINASDTVALGLADNIIDEEQKLAVLKALTQLSWNADLDGYRAQISNLLSEFTVMGPESQVEENSHTIQALTSGSSLTKIDRAIAAYQGDDHWMQQAAIAIRHACPTSLFLVYEQLVRQQNTSLRAVFQQELILSTNVVRLGNCREGIRALSIDKDRNPQFIPATVDDVTEAFIALHYINPWSEGEHPLASL
jgi:enoyl-CoA hydratase/carnithine racemase